MEEKINNWKLQIGNWKFKKGFTLVELMVVVSIIGVLAVIGYPMVSNLMPGYKLKSAAGEMAGDIMQARSLAVTNNTYYRFCVNGSASPQTLQYWIERGNTGNNPTTPCANIAPPLSNGDLIPMEGNSIPGTSKNLLAEYNNVEFVSSTFGTGTGGGANPSTFCGNGTGFSSGTIILKDTNGALFNVEVSRMGNVVAKKH